MKESKNDISSFEDEHIQDKLKEETIKWLNKIREVKIEEKEGNRQSKEIKRNIFAYIKDAYYFLEKGMLIEAFEAIIWAWAWLEIGEQMGFIEVVR